MHKIIVPVLLALLAGCGGEVRQPKALGELDIVEWADACLYSNADAVDLVRFRSSRHFGTQRGTSIRINNFVRAEHMPALEVRDDVILIVFNVSNDVPGASATYDLYCLVQPHRTLAVASFILQSSFMFDGRH